MQLNIFPKHYAVHLLLVLMISIVFSCGIYLLSDSTPEQFSDNFSGVDAWLFTIFSAVFYGLIISAGVIINNLIRVLWEHDGNYTFSIVLGSIIMMFYIEALNIYHINMSLAIFCTSLIALSIAVFFILNIAVELFFKWKQR